MSRLLNSYSDTFQKVLPSPMAIALLLTIVAAIAALCVSEPEVVLSAWSDGLWNESLMRFGFQAMFMLVMGHVLALAKPVRRVLNGVAEIACRSPHLAPAIVAGLAMTLGWLNWGLGLVAGALVAKAVIDRKVTHAGVVGAAGYMGILVWHSGLSGSASLKAAESGHLGELYPRGLKWSEPLAQSISISETVFTLWNLAITLGVMIAVVCLFLFLGKKVNQPISLSLTKKSMDDKVVIYKGREKSLAGFFDYGILLGTSAGAICLATAVWIAIGEGGAKGLSFINPDWINLLLLGLALVAHGSIMRLMKAMESAIGGAAGILLQFPIYFGIMGIVTGTGLVDVLSSALVNSNSLGSLPLAIFGSSGLLNIFVPSGGGQWAVQGPLILEACHNIGLSYEKGIMAMAYGDQWTNMLQPFWALPLLGITGLKARDILPYTLGALLVSGVVFMIGLVLIS